MLDKTSGSILAYQRSMLLDEERSGPLAQAVAQLVRPGDRVVDLGTGSGFLACIACRAGAGRVYAIEQGRAMALARSVCRDNGCSDRVRFLTGLSTTVSLPEPVDVVVTETIGNFGLEEGILGWLIDARRRFLKPGGALIPRSLKLFAAPVELGDEDRPTGSWPQALCGVDFSAAQVLEANNLHWLELRPDDLLSAPASLGSIDLCQVTDDTFSADVAVSITRDGTCHGIGGWFSAQLTSTVTLSNAPPLRTPSWRHAFLPLSAPLSVAAGDAVAISVACYRNGAFWAWRLAPGEPGGGDDDERRRPAPRQTTLAGQLLSAAELRLRRPSCVPVLSRQGRVDRFILGQFDGVASVAEIARRAMREFSECFRSEDDALERVRRLAVRYGGDA